MGACDCIITKVCVEITVFKLPFINCMMSRILLMTAMGFYVFIGWTWYNCRGVDQGAAYYSQRLHPWTS